MRKFKEVKRKEIIYDLSEWKQIERAAAKISMQTSEYIRRMSLARLVAEKFRLIGSAEKYALPRIYRRP